MSYSVRVRVKGNAWYLVGFLRERARLALEDPDGEPDAIEPMSQEQARRMMRFIDVLDLADKSGLDIEVTWHDNEPEQGRG